MYNSYLVIAERSGVELCYNTIISVYILIIFIIFIILIIIL